MDYMTHTLFGVAMYGALNKVNMDTKTKWALFAASVGANVIPDIDIQWARAGADYLMSHRGITHSFLMVPVWAVMFSLLSYAILRVKDRRIFIVAVVGVLLHIISDWTNAWGTGLLEPFTSRRYASGFVPNKGYVFWTFAAVLLPLLLLFRSKEHRRRIFRTFWVLGAVYVGFQLVHSAYVYADLKKDGYDQVAVRADRIPGGISYYAKKEDVVVEGRHEIGGESGIVRTFRNDPVDVEQLMQYRPARNLLLFAPFVVTQDLGESIRVFDPRFSGRVSILSVEVPASSRSVE
ncbi:metal-dependent hydrolase [Cohnella cholangitidis]|uniref:Metal-dependent hydrolase n=1 Tax=Cohnella cholangitidis TaxID=2598458 RepID=A0A7G5C4G0_9BACL|nr:metal-dependent hydrolase [Cohnella cholangitidis]QMV44094.1 metal-dependent hydrolase [Cohnella cholangitidis]